MKNIFSDAHIQKLTENQAKLCEEDWTKKYLYNSQKSMPYGKSSGNVESKKKLMKRFGMKWKKFLDFVWKAKEKEH